ncbi:MAG: SDR family oxidoreductase [Rhodocyclaceae bacterium]|jgi:NAD(P)-dependent dehydrogenase (short-subunit alcohol dehydrogenase family)|nr:SDR family oxidoreductase [Rhodocyclaceae bacterium]
MEIKDKVVIVTGGASGIGAALGKAFLEAGAKAVVAVDLKTDGAPAGSDARLCDVSREAAITALVRAVEERYGRIDVFCSNAGVLTPGWDVRTADFAVWERDWKINVLAHAVAAKAVLPGMMARGEGYLLNTASAAGLLATPEALIYTVTKHAAVALAEQLAFSYKRFGVRVSALCPMAVATPMVDQFAADGASAGLDGVLSVETVAAATLAGMRAEQFFIFPHAMVGDYFAKKAARHDKWLGAMEALQTRYADLHP